MGIMLSYVHHDRANLYIRNTLQHRTGPIRIGKSRVAVPRRGDEETPGLTNRIVAPRGARRGRAYTANERFFT
jgi:hypothetical protein